MYFSLIKILDFFGYEMYYSAIATLILGQQQSEPPTF